MEVGEPAPRPEVPVVKIVAGRAAILKSLPRFLSGSILRGSSRKQPWTVLSQRDRAALADTLTVHVLAWAVLHTRQGHCLLYAHKPREAQGSHIQCLTSHLGAPSHVPAEKEFPRELDRELRK
jgi:hypothetical protein